MIQEKPSHVAATATYWTERWRNQQTGWDFGAAHPALADLLKEAQAAGLASGSKILEPGCGRAHAGAALARLGYKVTAFDVAPEAIAAAEEAYAALIGNGLTLATASATEINPLWRGGFQAIYDRAVLCAFPPVLRRPYVEACFAHLEPGGLFLSIPFTSVNAPAGEGPPFQVSMLEMSELMLPGFSLLFAEERPAHGDGSKIVRETLSLWRRRKRHLVEGET